MQAILEQHTHTVVEFIKKEYGITNIKLPWVGKIVEDNCKGLRYNGGLYTQCSIKSRANKCCSHCSKNKYGSVYDRQKVDVGNYRDPKGRKEINYISYLKQNNISLKEAERACEREWGIKLPDEYYQVKRRGRPKKIQEVEDTDSDSEKKRGRPKKKKQIVEIKDALIESLIVAQQEEEVDCTEFEWENIIYWKDDEGNLYNNKTKEHMGIYDVDNNIVTLYC